MATIYGIHSINETLESGQLPDKVFVQRQSQGPALRELAGKLKRAGVPVQYVPPEKLDRLTRKQHQGIVALMPVVNYVSLDEVVSRAYETGEVPFLLLLDGITDVRNLGAIARSAECCGVHALVLPKRNSAQVGEDAIKTSSGALQHLSVCRTETVLEAAKRLQQHGLQIVACTEKTQDLFQHCDLTTPTAIVMGSEDLGISDEILRMADQLAAIPMTGKVGSLNVSVAAGIACYETLRQRISS